MGILGRLIILRLNNILAFLLLAHLSTQAHAFKAVEPFVRAKCETTPFAFRLDFTSDFPGEVTPQNWGQWDIWVDKCNLEEIVESTRKALQYYSDRCGKCSNVIAYVNAHGMFKSDAVITLPTSSAPHLRFKPDTRAVASSDKGKHILICGESYKGTETRGQIESEKVYQAINKLMEEFKCKQSQIWNDSCQSGMCTHNPQCSNGQCIMVTSGQGDATTPERSGFSEWAGPICSECDSDGNKIITFHEYEKCFGKLQTKMLVLDGSRAPYMGPPVVAGNSKRWGERVFFSCRDLTPSDLTRPPHSYLSAPDAQPNLKRVHE